jgi:hypothetical protein
MHLTRYGEGGVAGIVVACGLAGTARIGTKTSAKFTFDADHSAQAPQWF